MRGCSTVWPDAAWQAVRKEHEQMTTVIVSSDDRDVCRAIGTAIADGLGYRYLGRPLLDEVARQCGVQQERLHRLLDGAVGLRATTKSRALLARIQAAALEQLLEDNIVCVDLAAHLYVIDVPHVLVVRVLTDADARAATIAAHRRISTRKAQKLIDKEREQRRRWALDLFGVDGSNPANYDMVISLGQIEIDKVVDIIRDMAAYRKFQPTTYSLKCLADLTLAAKVRIALIEAYPDIKVSVDGKTASIRVKCAKRQQEKTVEEIEKLTRQVPGVEQAEVHTVSSMRELNRSAE